MGRQLLDDVQREWLTLSLVPGVGTTNFVKLLARFHSPHEVFRASEAALSEVVAASLAKRILQYREVVDIEAQERAMAQCGAQLITLDDPAYPPRLAEIYDPPLVLFARGKIEDCDQQAIAIVGTRTPTPYGVRMAERFARDLAAHGITVVSGMASGIDGAAHKGALEAGGRTIAVLGCGVDVLYPPEHGALRDQICQHGCVLSEYEMGMKPAPGNFPHRNRIISGMTLGTLVVEAPAKSGALITARFAAEQGREVFAVPGNVGIFNSQGPHALIREGAKLVETVDDILVELDIPAECRQSTPAAPPPKPVEKAQTTIPKSVPVKPQSAPVPPPVKPPVQPPPPHQSGPYSSVEQAIIASLPPEGSYIDEIALTCRIPVSEALATLTLLELRGVVRQFSGKRFALR